MKNTLTVNVQRKGSGFLIILNTDDPPAPGQPHGIEEDIASDFDAVRRRINKFFDKALTEPAKLPVK